MKTVEELLKDKLIDEFVEGCITQAVLEEDLYRRAVLKWGRSVQVDWAIEEMAELTQALCKSKRVERRKDWLFNVYEEMADVQIMLDTLIIAFSGENIVEMYKAQKLDRLERRLEQKPGMEK